MSGLKLTIAGAIASISLLTAVTFPSADPASRPPAARAISFDPSTSALMDDQLMFVRDMRKLRRELKRGAGSRQITEHRDEIRRDWLNIVTDRSLPGLRPGDITPELALWNTHPAQLLPSQQQRRDATHEWHYVRFPARAAMRPDISAGNANVHRHGTHPV